MNRQAILVLGMHRSGTSAVAGWLVRLGARGPRTPVSPGPDNPLGFWESEPICRFHERLLHAAGTDWDSWTSIREDALSEGQRAALAAELRTLVFEEFGDAPLFVVKDPRMCRLVPFWRRLLSEVAITPSAVLVYRQPLEVARSLEARNGVAADHGVLLWLRHMLDAERETRAMPRSVVRYTDLLEDWEPAAAALSSQLGVRWSADGGADGRMEDFLTPSLRHQKADNQPLPVHARLSGWALEACAAFEALANRDATHGVETMLDDLNRRIEDTSRLFDPFVDRERLKGKRVAEQLTLMEADRDRCHATVVALNSDCADLRATVAAADQEHADLLVQLSHLRDEHGALLRRLDETGQQLDRTNERVGDLLESRSWRWMAPLRRIWTLMSSIRTHMAGR